MNEGSKQVFWAAGVKRLDCIESDGANVIPLWFFKGAGHEYKLSWRMNVNAAALTATGNDTYYGICGNNLQLASGAWQRFYCSFANYMGFAFHVGNSDRNNTLGKSDVDGVWLNVEWTAVDHSTTVSVKKDDGTAVASYTDSGAVCLHLRTGSDWSDFPFYVLGNASNFAGIAGTKYSRFSVAVDGETAYDLVPALHDKAIGMWDLVGKQFYVPGKVS